MAFPKLLQKLFGNGGAGDKLRPEIVPITVNGQSLDSAGEATVSAVSPTITAVTQNLPAGSSATVTKTGTDAAPVFTFGLPKGDKGEKGADALPVVTIAGAVGPTANVTVGKSQTFVVPYLVFNARGQVTGYTNRTITNINCNCVVNCNCDCNDSDGT